MRYMNIASSSSKMSLAAEFKRASPSKGDINVHVDIIEQVMMMMILIIMRTMMMMGMGDDCDIR